MSINKSIKKQQKPAAVTLVILCVLVTCGVTLVILCVLVTCEFSKPSFPQVEKEMATHSRTEEPGGLLSTGSHRVRHDCSSFACMHALEKEMATHSSVLAWRIPGTEEPGGLPSMGLHRVGHD